MQSELTLGEYIRRKRREIRKSLIDLSTETGVSYSHLSRIESDSTLPNAETVTKVAKVLNGDLRIMLEMAQCLPREILDRIASQNPSATGSHNRSVYLDSPGEDESNNEDSDVVWFGLGKGLSHQDAHDLDDAVKILCAIQPQQRQQLIALIKSLGTESDDTKG